MTFKSSWLDIVLDKFFPLKSYRCGHAIRRINKTYGSQYYCDSCHLLIPAMNIERVKR